ncbi:hypothetical protein LY76DRAFT_412219 [Colletotrichum caudatum]|nr:hypothetical protein LY76DRAFT_412219 [Colletotrichum caudatum]
MGCLVASMAVSLFPGRSVLCMKCSVHPPCFCRRLFGPKTRTGRSMGLRGMRQPSLARSVFMRLGSLPCREHHPPWFGCGLRRPPDHVWKRIWQAMVSRTGWPISATRLQCHRYRQNVLG